MSDLPPVARPKAERSEEHDERGNAHDERGVFVRLARAVSTLSAFTLLSRVFGLVREKLVANFIGPGAVMDAYVLALKLPNMFRQMFAEGALSASFVPLFTERRDTHGEAAAREFASAIASVMMLVVGVLTLVAIVFMPQIVRWFAPDPASYDLAVLFARIMSIYLLCMVVTSLVTGVLNAKQHFAAGAIAPVFFNLFIIGGLVFAAVGLDLPPAAQGTALAIGVAAAGVAQVIFVWAVAALRFRFVLYVPVPRFGPDARRLFRLMLPGMIAAGGLQLNTLVGLYLSLRNTADASYLALAERLYQLPVGLIAVAFGVAALPQLSDFVARGQRDKVLETIGVGFEFGLMIAIPAAVALAAMPDLLVIVLFEGGAFTRQDTAEVAALIAVFALALPALALMRVFNASFHARKHMRPPMIMTLVGVGINITLAVGLYPTLGLSAVPLAMAVSAWAQVTVLALWVRRLGLWRPALGTAWRSVATFISAGAMGVSIWLVKPWVLGWADGSILLLVAATMALVVVGGALYAASMLVTRGVHPRVLALLPGADAGAGAGASH